MFCYTSTETVCREKTPKHLFVIRSLFEHFPGLRVIALVRDPRDTVPSMMKLPGSHQNTRLNAMRWAKCAAQITSLKQTFDERVYVLRLEDFLLYPNEKLDDIMQFLGEDPQSRQFETGAGRDVIPGWEQGWKAQAAQKIDTNKVQAWKHGVPRSTVVMIESLTIRHLKQLGYESDYRIVVRLSVRVYHQLINTMYWWIFASPITGILHSIKSVFEKIGIRFDLVKTTEMPSAEDV